MRKPSPLLVALCVIAPCLMFGAWALVALLLQWAWNAVVPDLFGAPRAGYLHAFVAVMLLVCVGQLLGLRR